jgi:hypothetical protein
VTLVTRAVGFVVVGAVLAASASARTFRVRAGESVQAAIDAALAEGGDNEVRVAAGTYRERLTVDDRLGSGRLALSGGWHETFSYRLGETIVDGGGVSPVVGVTLRNGELTADRLTVTGGGKAIGPAPGGGLRVTLTGEASVVLDRCVVRDNHLVDKEVASAGGLSGDLFGRSRLVVRQSAFRGNSVTANQAWGAGAFVSTLDGAWARIEDNEFSGNRTEGREYSGAAGLDAIAGPGSAIEVAGNRIEGNRAGANPCCAVSLGTSRLDPPGPGVPRVTAERNVVQDNEVGLGAQVDVSVGSVGVLQLRDSVVAKGSGDGIWTSTDLEGVFTETNNLAGVDPRFVDAAAADYHLGPASPAIDAGENAPPGGLGPLDIDHTARLQGARVDIGADEVAVFAPPPGRGPGCYIVGLPGQPLPFPPRWTNACRCLADEGLREFHCRFFLADLFLDARFPIPVPGAPLPLEWTLHPSSEVEGPYSMAADLWSPNGEWVAQEWLGPKAEALKPDQLVTEPFLLKLPDEVAAVRTTLQYTRRGGKEPVAVVLEMTLPAAIDPKKP